MCFCRANRFPVCLLSHFRGHQNVGFGPGPDSTVSHWVSPPSLSGPLEPGVSLDDNMMGSLSFSLLLGCKSRTRQRERPIFELYQTETIRGIPPEMKYSPKRRCHLNTAKEPQDLPILQPKHLLLTSLTHSYFNQERHRVRLSVSCSASSAPMNKTWWWFYLLPVTDVPLCARFAVQLPVHWVPTALVANIPGCLWNASNTHKQALVLWISPRERPRLL